MKLRLFPILLTIGISAVLLFGGWFAYQEWMVKAPLTELVQEIDGVDEAKVETSTDDVRLVLELNPQANLREVVQTFKREAADLVGGKTLDIQIENESTEALEQWWSSALFDIAQAMETKQYSMIPATLEAKKQGLAGLEVQAEMDDQYVYIQLVQGDASKFVMLPRQPAQMGVWTNEQI